MMHQVHQGIVLRTYIPRKQKLSLFDAYLGRVDCVPQNTKNAQRLFHGAYISYALKSWGRHYLIYDIALVAAPPYSAHTSLLFFHHLLELCHYFLPLEHQEHTLFALVKGAYTHPEFLQTELTQRLFLYHFFKEIGIYPVDMQSYDPSFFRLISSPFDSKVNARDEERLSLNLRKWLLGCINTHPYAHYLKTIDFLKKVVA
jgi:hypothetical protein